MLINKKTCVAVLFLVIAASFFATAHAQEYRFLAPLPGSGEAVQAGSAGFSSYMANVYWFFLSGAVILALVMLIIGGVEYVGSAGNTSLLQDAKGRMVNAIVGLLLALISWLILNTINPDLVDFSLPIANINLPKTLWDGALTGGAGTQPPTTPPPGTPPAPVDGNKQPPPPPPPPPTIGRTACFSPSTNLCVQTSFANEAECQTSCRSVAGDGECIDPGMCPGSGTTF